MSKAAFLNEAEALKNIMRVYSSFLIRCWLTDDPSQEKQSLLQVEHIQTGASTRAEKFSEIEPWIFEACRGLKSRVEAPPDGEANRETPLRVGAGL